MSTIVRNIPDVPAMLLWFGAAIFLFPALVT